MKKFILLSLGLSLLTGPGAYAGTVSGKVLFSGTAPESAPLDVAADPACMAGRAQPPLDESVVVNQNGALQNVFVYVKEGLEGKTFPAPATPVVLDQKGCLYHPRVFGIQTGQELQILNSDATLHNVHGLPKLSKEFNLGMPIQGMKTKRTFEKPEVMVKFKCDVHPWMSAYAGVLPHPFYSVTDQDGAFQIKDLAPGNYVLEAWHEKYGVQTQKITVPESGDGAIDFSFAG